MLRPSILTTCVVALIGFCAASAAHAETAKAAAQRWQGPARGTFTGTHATYTMTTSSATPLAPTTPPASGTRLQIKRVGARMTVWITNLSGGATIVSKGGGRTPVTKHVGRIQSETISPDGSLTLRVKFGGAPYRASQQRFLSRLLSQEGQAPILFTAVDSLGEYSFSPDGQLDLKTYSVSTINLPGNPSLHEIGVYSLRTQRLR